MVRRPTQSHNIRDSQISSQRFLKPTILWVDIPSRSLLRDREIFAKVRWDLYWMVRASEETLHKIVTCECVGAITGLNILQSAHFRASSCHAINIRSVCSLPAILYQYLRPCNLLHFWKLKSQKYSIFMKH